MLNHKDDRAVTAEINDRLAKILVRKLLKQKRSLIRAIEKSLADLESMLEVSLGEQDEWSQQWATQVSERLKKTLKRNSSKPALWE